MRTRFLAMSAKPSSFGDRRFWRPAKPAVFRRRYQKIRSEVYRKEKASAENRMWPKKYALRAVHNFKIAKQHRKHEFMSKLILLVFLLYTTHWLVFKTQYQFGFLFLLMHFDLRLGINSALVNCLGLFLTFILWEVWEEKRLLSMTKNVFALNDYRLCNSKTFDLLIGLLTD